MTRPLAAAACLLASLVAAGCGASVRAAAVYTSPEAPRYTLPAGKHYIGRGSKKLGTIVVARRSVLRWASDGVAFQLWDRAQRIRVRTQAHSGSVALEPGTYKGVAVLAIGEWVITITPVQPAGAAAP